MAGYFKLKMSVSSYIVTVLRPADLEELHFTAIDANSGEKYALKMMK
jgi:hypothetical protein